MARQVLAIHIEGTNGQTLRDKWRDSCSTWLGVMVHGFPNMLMPAGPQSGSASTNYPRGIETGVNWCTEFLRHVRQRGDTRFEATVHAEARWTAHVVGMYSIMLMRNAKGWFTGYNSNVPGHEEGKVRYFVYNGGSPKYVERINSVAAKSYEGVTLDGTRAMVGTAAE